MPKFDLSHAGEVLSSKYKATWMQTYPLHNSLEAETSLSLQNELLILEITVDEAGIRTTDIRSLDIRKIQPLEPLDFQNKTSSYATHPEVVKYLERIKHDIGLP